MKRHEIVLLREAAGLSAWEVALRTGIHPSRLSRIENRRIRPRPEELDAMLKVFGLDAGTSLADARRFLAGIKQTGGAGKADADANEAIVEPGSSARLPGGLADE